MRSFDANRPPSFCQCTPASVVASSPVSERTNQWLASTATNVCTNVAPPGRTTGRGSDQCLPPSVVEKTYLVSTVGPVCALAGPGGFENFVASNTPSCWLKNWGVEIDALLVFNAELLVVGSSCTCHVFPPSRVT